MKKLFFSTILVVSATVLLSGCLGGSQSTSPNSTESKIDAADKVGETTKVGTISAIGDKFYLQEAGQEPKQVESYAVDLSQYVGQTVTVVGQYSGDTLFIGRVE